MNEDMLQSAIRGTKRAGQSKLIKYLKGGRLTQKESIAAKCYDCNGMGEQADCIAEDCPLYPYSPYKIKAGTRAA